MSNVNRSDFVKEFRELLIKYDLRSNDDILFFSSDDCGGSEFLVVAHDDPNIVVALENTEDEQ